MTANSNLTVISMIFPGACFRHHAAPVAVKEPPVERAGAVPLPGRHLPAGLRGVQDGLEELLWRRFSIDFPSKVVQHGIKHD